MTSLTFRSILDITIESNLTHFINYRSCSVPFALASALAEGNRARKMSIRVFEIEQKSIDISLINAIDLTLSL